MPGKDVGNIKRTNLPIQKLVFYVPNKFANNNYVLKKILQLLLHISTACYGYPRYKWTTMTYLYETWTKTLKLVENMYKINCNLPHKVCKTFVNKKYISRLYIKCEISARKMPIPATLNIIFKILISQKNSQRM